jgi:hypothetical protein
MTKLSWMHILWPSFLAACMLEMLVFVLIDPAELHWTHGIDPWSSLGIYSIGFFLFWAVTLFSSITTSWLRQSTPD